MESYLSDTDEPVAKKLRTSKNLKNKKCQDKKNAKRRAKSSTISRKNTPRNYMIVRTILNDFLPDDISDNVEDLTITNDKNCPKEPLIKLQTIDNNTYPSAILPDATLLTKENKEIGLENFSFLDLCELKLNEYTGYEPDRNIDLSKKMLNLKIQCHELNVTKWGGITPDPSYSDTRYEQCRTAVKESTEYDRDSSNGITDISDDDDVISLFAESISGTETNLRNPPTLSPIEEQGTENGVLKVSKQEVLINPCNVKNSLNFCEKQNADSTSLLMEYPKPGKNLGINFSAMTSSSTKSKGSYLMEKLHTPVSFVKSNVFKGVCIFFVSNKCRKNRCNFPHFIPSDVYINGNIVNLSHNQFIEEYLMLRNNVDLFKKYGLLYVRNCVCRNEPRTLVEMAYNFATTFGSDNNLQENKKLYVEVMEVTLLYLNNVDLDNLTDLLNLKIKSVLLCEKFLEVIGETQNFSRFKTVFLNLTKIMCSQNNTFNSEVVSQILDRVSILAYSPEMSRALLDMMRRTDVKVLPNSIADLFAKKLSEYNVALFHEFTNLMGSKDPFSDSHNSTMTVEEPQLAGNDVRCSPDTTNNDRSDERLQGHQIRYTWPKAFHVPWFQKRLQNPRPLPNSKKPFDLP